VVKELGMEAEQVVGAVVRLEEGIRMEEDSGELGAREEVIRPEFNRSWRWTACITGRSPPWELGDGSGSRGLEDPAVVLRWWETGTGNTVAWHQRKSSRGGA
jgi:hypothetical protein